jgi:hypothetical protein
MVELGPDRVEEAALEGGTAQMLIDERALPDEEKHRQATEEVEGKKTVRDGGRSGFRDAHASPPGKRWLGPPARPGPDSDGGTLSGPGCRVKSAAVRFQFSA